MANELTGDFDVVAEFAFPASNRVLAAMHRSERLPHSAAFHVDDNPPPGSKGGPALVEIVSVFGDPIVDHGRIRPESILPGTEAATNPVHGALDPIVNGDLLTEGLGPIVPSRLRGRLQAQLAPPTIEAAPGSPGSVTVRIPVMARYFPDPGTGPLPEFIQGELLLTAAVSQVASPVANVIEVGIKADDVAVAFNSKWSSRPLTAEEQAGIVQLIRNALKTSLLPSNMVLPPTVQSLQLKMVGPGPGGAVGALLKLAKQPPEPPGPADPATVSNVFLVGADDFALGVSGDFLLAAFAPVLNQIRNRPIPPVPVNAPITGATTYTVTLLDVSAALQAGKIVLTIQGRATTPSWLPNFNFTVRQDLTLQASGDSAVLVVGDISLTTSSWVVNLFKGGALDSIRAIRDSSLAATGVAESVRRLLSADQNLGPFIDSLLEPVRPKHGHGNLGALEGVTAIGDGAGGPRPYPFDLAYTSVEIRPSGIVLHGSLAVPSWPPAHAEFETIPTAPGTVTTDLVSSGPDYSALKSWIPGGTITGYEWALAGQPPLVDEHRFVRLGAGSEPPATAVASAPAGRDPLHGYAPLCLTVRGMRLSSAGPVVAEPVSAIVCSYSSIGVLGVALAGTGGGAGDRAQPLVALTRTGTDGRIEITGHTAAAQEAMSDTPARVIHFGDETAVAQLEAITRTVNAVAPKGVPTAVVGVLTPERLAKTRHLPGVIYGADEGDAWARAFGAGDARRPLTLVVTAKGDVAWRHEGPVDKEALAPVLKKTLAAGKPINLRLMRLTLRIGQPAPDFLFELAPHRQLTLRKLAGRPVVLVFWRSASKPSLEAVRDAAGGAGTKAAAGRSGRPAAVVLAINDGDSPEAAKRAATEAGPAATFVPDPKRRISSAYGVSVWPTTVRIDAAGLVREMQYGRQAGGSRHV
jgi:peroxiredoxin